MAHITSLTRAFPKQVAPSLLSGLLQEAQDKKKEMEDTQAKASGLARQDAGYGPIWVYDVPTQNAIGRMRRCGGTKGHRATYS